MISNDTIFYFATVSGVYFRRWLHPRKEIAHNQRNVPRQIRNHLLLHQITTSLVSFMRPTSIPTDHDVPRIRRPLQSPLHALLLHDPDGLHLQARQLQFTQTSPRRHGARAEESSFQHVREEAKRRVPPKHLRKLQASREDLSDPLLFGYCVLWSFPYDRQ